MKKTIVVILILLGLAATAFFARKQLIRGALPVVEKISGGRISIVNDSARIRLDVVVRNKGWVSYHLTAVSIDVSNDTLLLVHYLDDSSYVLEKNERKTFSIEFDFPLKEALERIRNLQDRDSTMIAVRGWIDLETAVGEVRMPVVQDFPVEVPIPPQIQVHEIEYVPGGKDDNKSAPGKFYNFRVKVSVINLNRKKFEFKDVSYDFYAGELIESHGRLEDILIDALDSTYMTLPLQVEVEQRAKLLYQVITNKDRVNYTIMMRGTIVSLGGFDQEISATFRNDGMVELYNPERKKIPITIRRKNARKS